MTPVSFKHLGTKDQEQGGSVVDQDTLAVTGADGRGDAGPRTALTPAADWGPGRIAAVAATLVAHRRAGQALPLYPDTAPPDLATAYAIQDAAIALWPDRIIGWKVGGVPPHWQETLGARRLVGPIFAGDLRPLGPEGAMIDVPVFVGGFAAVEAEFVLIPRAAPDPARATWDAASAGRLDLDLAVAVETAGSPLPAINDLGPCVVASDFGNNAGLILGPRLDDWRARGFDAMTTTTEVDGRVVGRGSAASVPGGPFESLAELLTILHARGLRIAAGDLISTGATTGIHEVVAGQTARAVFGGTPP